MMDAGRRPMGRHFYLPANLLAYFLMTTSVVCALMLVNAPANAQGGPATTVVADTVYQADATAASGSLIIFWPAFMTAGGTPVAPGVTTTTLGAGGALSVALVPNAGASPAGMYYSVVYQLGPGQVKTEYWVVPTTSPANLAAVRTTPGAGAAAQPVSLQFVNTALAAKANDNSVVHLSGTETITGAKTFSAAPNVPTPTTSTNIANKGYVDSAVAAVGAGSFIPLAGGTMTGPLTLSGNPVAPFQAAPKQYVDTAFAAKADLVSGLVPVGELGSGTANSGTCLLGNGTWGVCGAGGTGNVSTTPTGTQNITQPAGTIFTVNNLNGIVYAPAFNWSQTLTGNLTAGANTVTLTNCPLGVDVSMNNPYYVTINNGAETDLVTGGTCAAGASGTIAFTTANAYTTPTIGAANGGIQEALNYAGGTAGSGNQRWHVMVPPGGYNVYAPIVMHASKGLLEGDGADLNCYTRSYCLLLGTLTNSNSYNADVVRGFRFRPQFNDPGCTVTQTQRSSGTSTVTYTGSCSYKVGDLIRVDFTDNPGYWGDHFVSAVTSTSVSWLQGSGSIAAQTTPGTIALANDAILDNGNSNRWQDLRYAEVGSPACSNDPVNTNICNFNAFFDFWDDENAVIDGFDNDGFGLMCSSTYCGSFIYSGGTVGGSYGTSGVVAPVISVRGSNFTAGCANGVTVYNSNGLHIQDTVIQAVALWNVLVNNIGGNFQGAMLDNVYNESTGCPNTPWGRLGTAGAIYGPSTGASTFTSHGLSLQGKIPTTGSGSTNFNYWIVGRDVTANEQTAPMLVQQTQNNQTGAITVSWPRLAPNPTATQSSTDTITYDVIRTSGGLHQAWPPSSGPMPGNCPGGSITACGSVATAVAQCASLVCTFTDSGSGATSAYSVNLSGNFQPTMTYWPGDLVLGGTMPSQVFLDKVPSVVNAPQGIAGGPVMYTLRCGADEGTWVGCAGDIGYGPSSIPVPPATVMANVIGNPLGGTTTPKGRLNFYSLSGNAFGGSSIVTLWDSNPGKTLSSVGNRPTMDAADTYLASDNSGQGFANNAVQLAIGAPVSISQYVNNLPDNAHWLERLTSSLKEFKVPAKFDSTVTLPVTGSGSQCLHVSATGVLSGTGADCGAGSGSVITGTPSQLAVYSAGGLSVSGDTNLSDNGTTLNYSGSGGIAASSGTFSGNLTVNGQLFVSGPWSVSSPIPGTAMGAASAGTSSLGISSDGNFYISSNSGTPQQVATTATSSYFSNLFQEDVNDIGEYNGTTPQNLHVYSSYTNSSTWTRASLGYDATDNYSVLRSESSPSGSAPGLGFWLNSGLKWVIDSTSNFKPWTDQVSNIGSYNGASSSGLRPGTVYVAGNSTSGSGFELGKFANESYELCNDTSTGTVVNGLAVLTTGGCAAKPTSALTSGAIGIVIVNAGTSGIATLARAGSVFCSFDATATVVGDFVVPSSTGSAYLCHDAGSTRPVGTQILGRVLQASSGSATVQMFLDMPGSNVSNSLTAAGTGSCTNQVVTSVNSGAPTCMTVTSAYVDSSIALTASPTLTGAPLAPTATVGDNSTKIATTAYVKNETQFAWTCPVAGSTAVSQNCNWTLPAGLTITGFDFAANTAPVGCTTYPVVQVWDGTAGAEVGSYSITLSTGTNFYTQVTGSANVASGHQLRVKVTTAASGCTTTAQGLVATVTYQMQN